MTAQLVVQRNRTNRIPVNVGFDATGETFTSQIRAEESITSDELATWAVTFDTDGSDGELILTLEEADVSNIAKSYGYMDIKRVSGGKSLSVFNKPLEVLFQGVVTE